MLAQLSPRKTLHLTGFFGKIVVVLRERACASVLKRPLDPRGALVVVIVALSVVSYHFLGSDLLPEMDEGGFILDYYTPPGSSLERIESHSVCISKRC